MLGFFDTLGEQHEWEICHLVAIACWEGWRSVCDSGQRIAKEKVVDSRESSTKGGFFLDSA